MNIINIEEIHCIIYGWIKLSMKVYLRHKSIVDVINEFRYINVGNAVQKEILTKYWKFGLMRFHN